MDEQEANIRPCKCVCKLLGTLFWTFYYAALLLNSRDKMFSIRVMKLKCGLLITYILMSSENTPISTIPTSRLFQGCFGLSLR